MARGVVQLKPKGREGRRDSHGQPQCLRKATITGLPSGRGKGNFSVLGALEPISGGEETGTEVGVGLIHEASSCWRVIVCVYLNGDED